MAVTPKKDHSVDKAARGKVKLLEYVNLNKSNRKGTAALLGGELVDEPWNASPGIGDFHILYPGKSKGRRVIGTNDGKGRLLTIAITGDVVFKVAGQNHWQVAPKAAFKKRFPDVGKH